MLFRNSKQALSVISWKLGVKAVYNNSRDEYREKFSRKIEEKEKRKIKARRQKNQGIWFGLGMFGVVGWSVSIPAVIGIAAGVWIDTKLPGRFSWTIMLLFLGVVLGCANAWYWLKREREIIEKENKEE